ncbi:DUF4365 domain-containing protein [Micromonospora sp. 4G55]|uniref:DUF4365 domain-containing protein n=1 Tax=Micromonospora sp. 4G55 TaxID=2806102 RepID=UPI001A412328|nr:DUF4365 domain-containing protein [Micromonospora sp. 4G55]MBM0255514.1 DUF4365 domain-containing protein [Micromonospora sp. 4G55]
MAEVGDIPTPLATGPAGLTHEPAALHMPTQRIEPVDARTFTTLLEQLQMAYVAAVAATAGCTMEPVDRDVWGFDAWLIRPPLQIGVGEEVPLAVQLKNTTTLKPDPNSGTFSYQFKQRKYFDALAFPRRGVQGVCLVMASPPRQASWTTPSHEFLRLEHCCYWVNLKGIRLTRALSRQA